MIDLDALQAAADAATPGPWSVDGPWWHSDEPANVVSAGEQRQFVAIAPPHHNDLGRRDMTFIALANPETVKALVAVVRAAQTIRDAPYFGMLSPALAPFVRSES